MGVWQQCTFQRGRMQPLITNKTSILQTIQTAPADYWSSAPANLHSKSHRKRTRLARDWKMFQTIWAERTSGTVVNCGGTDMGLDPEVGVLVQAANITAMNSKFSTIPIILFTSHLFHKKIVHDDYVWYRQTPINMINLWWSSLWFFQLSDDDAG